MLSYNPPGWTFKVESNSLVGVVGLCKRRQQTEPQQKQNFTLSGPAQDKDHCVFQSTRKKSAAVCKANRQHWHFAKRRVHFWIKECCYIHYFTIFTMFQAQKIIGIETHICTVWNNFTWILPTFGQNIVFMRIVGMSYENKNIISLL